jgi:ABC-type lipopolysaccharide export system ATPase subunit
MIHKLEADSIELNFGTWTILKDIYITCETGKITGFLGRNGEGKSCLMNIICGNLEPQNKSIRVNNKAALNIGRQPDLLKHLPQFNFIPKSLSLRRVFRDYQIDFSCFEKDFPELGVKCDSLIKNLSGGQIRIIELYIILRSKTKFVILDEPFTHIMPVHVEQIKKIINEEKMNKGIIITDHVYQHVLDLSDYLYVLVNGKTYLAKDISDVERLGYCKF